MDLEFFNKVINNIKESDLAQNFRKELKKFLENNCNTNEINQTNKYSEYWEYQNFMEDNVAANIGISRWSKDVSYYDELSDVINNSILELSQKEGTLYRKKFIPNGHKDSQTYSIDKFENGKVQNIILQGDKVPKGFENEDIIFQYKPDGSTKVRNDLKEKVIQFASKSAEYLKVKENKKIIDYKREEHIYKAIENDGYIFLKDLTEKRDYVVEDIDFVVDCYEGDGKYQVINGEYKKIEE